jgi:UDPglucose 6-dehydrogenase/GDP-mannose 6-dehydrogenase
MAPDRVVLGGIDGRTLDALAELYDVFQADVVRTTCKTAEMIKYASNALLATLISFSNEIGNLCAALGGTDIVDVMNGVHLDRRLSPIGPDGTRVKPGITTYLQAGCGFGGSCFPKDVRALIAHGKQAGAAMHVLDAVVRVNEVQPRQVMKLLEKHFPSLREVRVAVLGLAFKPGTDDMRESPAIPVIHALHHRGAQIRAYDPVACAAARKVFNGSAVAYYDDLESAVVDSDAIVLLTSWPEFSALPDLLSNLESQPLVVDGRRALDARRISRYEGIGLS